MHFFGFCSTIYLLNLDEDYLSKWFLYNFRTSNFHLNFCKIQKINSRAKISLKNAQEPHKNFHEGTYLILTEMQCFLHRNLMLFTLCK